MTDATHQPVVVFDFDHTLTTFDTGSAFFSWLLKRDTWRVASLAIVSPLLLPLLIFRGTRKIVIRAAIWTGTLGRSPQDIASLCDEFAQDRLESGDTAFHQDGLLCLRAHLSKGHTVIIATGTLSALAAALLKRAELTGVIIIGSSLKTFLFGMIAHEHCYGLKKVEMIEGRGFMAPWSAAYTDHESDFCVLANSRERYLVNPKAKTTSAFRLRFSAEPTILRWR